MYCIKASHRRGGIDVCACVICAVSTVVYYVFIVFTLWEEGQGEELKAPVNLTGILTHPSYMYPLQYFSNALSYYNCTFDMMSCFGLVQISIDVPRMNPDVPLFQQKVVQECFQRILFIWSMRHPASGYVQGINDLVTPFFVVFLSYYICEWLVVSM